MRLDQLLASAPVNEELQGARARREAWAEGENSSRARASAIPPMSVGAVVIEDEPPPP